MDGAFGGVARCSKQYVHLLKGINLADSITVDAHKWLNVPYDSAIQFTKHKKLQSDIFYNRSAYLKETDKNPAIFNMTPENSRRLRALPLWFSLMAYGKNGYADIRIAVSNWQTTGEDMEITWSSLADSAKIFLAV